MASKGTKNKLHMTYFDIRGRVEPVRLMCAMKGMPVDETRVVFSDWPKVKPTTPNGQLPFVKMESGQILTQSNAIIRYFAKRTSLYGKGAEQEAFVDEVLYEVSEMYTILPKCRFGDDESKAAGVKELNTKQGPEFVARMEKRANAGKTKGILIGDTLTVADLAVYDMLENLTDVNPEALAKAPGLKELKNKVIGNKNIKEYLAKRAKTPF